MTLVSSWSAPSGFFIDIPPAKHFNDSLFAINPETLLPAFDSLVQNLFKNAAHSTANASLTIAKETARASLLRTRGSAGLTKQDERFLRNMPTDIRTVYGMFNLEPRFTIFASCTERTCCAIYPPVLDESSGVVSYPPICLREKFGRICGLPIVKQGVQEGLSVTRPRRPFAYRHFNDHVASMLSRPGIEKAIESHWQNSSRDTQIHDIVHSHYLRDLKDPDGEPFLRSCGTELRLVWALGVDWYNPYHNKAAGKSASSGVIAMICLSLPPELRLREENIFQYEIPGPHEPSLDATNNFLDPVIFDLQVAYNPGMYFSRTHDFPSGRVARSAVVPEISDTLASKKVTGNVGHAGKYFCSRCRLHRSEMNQTDETKWPKALTREEHEALANGWLRSPTKTKQEAFAKNNGIRWSSLLRNKYWIPSLYTVLDGLHVILLNVVMRHNRDLLGLDIRALQDEDIEVAPEVLAKAQIILGQKSAKTLKSLRVEVLKALCNQNNITVPPPVKGRRCKRDYISALLVCANHGREVLCVYLDSGRYLGSVRPYCWRQRLQHRCAL